MAQIFSSPFAQYTDASGNPGSGDKLYFYQTGTTTLLTIYSDIGLTTPQANPIIADSAGQWPAVYLAEQLYKVVMKSALDVTIRTADPAGGDGVTGTTSSTDNAVARWDGTSGHKLQNSGVIIDDSSNVTGIVNLTATALLGAGRPPTQQTFTASGTWTKPAGCVKVIFEAVAGGGAGGGVAGTAGAGKAAAGGGGSSGRYGRTALLDVSAVSTAAIVIGAAGAAVNAAAGGDGGDTTVTVGAITYTWGKGQGGFAGTMGTSVNQIILGNGAVASTNLAFDAYDIGGRGLSNGTDTTAVSGEGGFSPYGCGGFYVTQTTTGSTAGTAAVGYGCGGSGAAGVNTNTTRGGGAGTAGLVIAWEFY